MRHGPRAGWYSKLRIWTEHRRVCRRTRARPCAATTRSCRSRRAAPGSARSQARPARPETACPGNRARRGPAAREGGRNLLRHHESARSQSRSQARARPSTENHRNPTIQLMWSSCLNTDLYSRWQGLLRCLTGDPPSIPSWRLWCSMAHQQGCAGLFVLADDHRVGAPADPAAALRY